MTDTFGHFPMNHLSSLSFESSESTNADDVTSSPSSLLLPRFSSQKNTKKPYASPSMQGYQQKMKLAQASKGICYGSGQTVGRMPLKQLLNPSEDDENTNLFVVESQQIPLKFQVPMFQRRYCWTETQWQTLLMDAATTKDGLHSLGRLTCTNNNATPIQREEKVSPDDQRSIILDGQQRFTTVTLLLAAIRDALYKRQQRAMDKKVQFDHEKATQIIAEIDEILFPELDDFQQWLKTSPALEEGMELKFAKLIPTYCDRWSYYSAILPQHWNISNRLTLQDSHTAFHRPLVAKQYYDGMLSMFSNGEIFSLLDGIYTKLTMLLFPIEFAGRTDGTEDLMVVYERLAIRDATWCTPTRQNEYVTMSGLDMIRNALLGSFAQEAKALEFYQSYWLPMERMAARSTIFASEDASHQQEQEESNLHSMIRAFLDQQLDQEKEEEKVQEGIVGGILYTRFQLWQDIVVAASSMMTVEQTTHQQGQAMLAFAKSYFKTS